MEAEPYQHAQTLLALARTHLATADPHQARTHAHHALDLAHHTGATHAAQQVRLYVAQFVHHLTDVNQRQRPTARPPQ